MLLQRPRAERSLRGGPRPPSLNVTGNGPTNSQTRDEPRLDEKSHGESHTRQQTHKAATPAAIGPEEREDRVAEAAYLRAEHRGFLPGCELQEWLDAEAEIHHKA
jgi:hypothetical protein